MSTYSVGPGSLARGSEGVKKGQTHRHMLQKIWDPVGCAYRDGETQKLTMFAMYSGTGGGVIARGLLRSLVVYD